ncbi:uncharacterized protein N7500_000870 [Penicillium coprophilum]|uniref:uncharacterized protein n=1 Tax=Penicillium coprophilum TaxID=36646 RepID=UPI0023A0EFED|nr:uncharacterized protein N7500_000870 [Penicillium coprophilum]KAJ5178171.1 hypothetical protein N7500_000870 [Penicillium coprophilum]
MASIYRKSASVTNSQLTRLQSNRLKNASDHFVYQPLGMSFDEFQSLCPGNKLPHDLLQKSVQLTLISLVFVHGNDVVHTGELYLLKLSTKLTNLFRKISTSNILQEIEDISALPQRKTISHLRGSLKRSPKRKLCDTSSGPKDSWLHCYSG